MTRSVMEGVAYAIRYALDALGRPDTASVAMTGGVGRSDAMQTLLACILGAPLNVQSQSDVSLGGAVAYAAVVSGIADSTQAVAHAMQGDHRVLEATSEQRQAYAEGYQGWFAALQTLTTNAVKQTHTSEPTL
jgi:sugar (pentulose or hexulose) kinase